MSTRLSPMYLLLPIVGATVLYLAHYHHDAHLTQSIGYAISSQSTVMRPAQRILPTSGTTRNGQMVNAAYDSKPQGPLDMPTASQTTSLSSIDRHGAPSQFLALALGAFGALVSAFLLMWHRTIQHHQPTPEIIPLMVPIPVDTKEPWRVASASGFHANNDFVPGLAGMVIDKEEAFRLADNGDRLITALAANGEVVVRAVNLSNLMGEVQATHGTSPLVTVALGQALSSALLLSAGRRDELETFQLRIRGDGPLGGVTAVADGTGRVRGFCGNHQVQGVDMGTAIGKGVVEVVRSHPNPDFFATYSGITEIAYGNVPQDVALYLDKSEQIRSALAAGVVLPKPGTEGSTFCGGYVVQLLPGASESTINVVELNIAKLLVENDAQGAGELLQKGITPAKMVEELLLDLQPGNWTASSPRWWCKECSPESVYAVMNILPTRDLQDILDSPEELNARCEWCCKDLPLERQRIEALLNLRVNKIEDE